MTRLRGGVTWRDKNIKTKGDYLSTRARHDLALTRTFSPRTPDQPTSWTDPAYTCSLFVCGPSSSQFLNENALLMTLGTACCSILKTTDTEKEETKYSYSVKNESEPLLVFLLGRWRKQTWLSPQHATRQDDSPKGQGGVWHSVYDGIFEGFPPCFADPNPGIRGK